MKASFSIGITGGMGLVGKALRSSLSSPVIFISRQESTKALKLNEKCLIGSFTDSHIQDEFISKVDVLIHAATSVGPRSEFESQFIENDLIGTLALAKNFFKSKPYGHFIYLSTSGGLYDLNDPNEKTEQSEIDPKSLYGAIKLLIEDSLQDLSGNHGLVTIVRPAPVYGDSLKKNLTVGLIDKLLKSTFTDSINEAAVPIFDNMNSARDYLHVDDLSSALKALINREHASRFEIYNIGTGKETSILEVIKTINTISERPVQYKVLPVDKKPTSLIVNSDKIFTDTGWKAQINLHDGILKMKEIK